MLTILQLTKKVPFPLKDGESIAVTQIAKGLVDNNCIIDLLSFNPVKHFVDINFARKGMGHYREVHGVFLDNRIKYLDAFINLFSKQSYNVSRFITSSFRNKLIEQLKTNEYDIIIIESLFMCPYIETIRNYSDAKIVFRSHNIEYLIWERLGKNEKSFLKGQYINILARRLKQYEISMLNKYDMILPISSVDEDFFLSQYKGVNILTMPTGLDIKRYGDSKKHIETPVKFFFLGSLDWLPNIEGLKWFLEKVWSNINFPAELNVAGRNCPKWLTELQIKGVNIIGEVEDAHKFMGDNDVMIVPLFSGSGIRIKILESMAIGKTVISTNIGIEGIAVIPDEEVFIANDEIEFIEQLEFINTNKEKAFVVASQAQLFINKYYNFSILSKELYESLSNL